MLEIHEAADKAVYKKITDTLPEGRDYKIIESYSRSGEVTGYGIYSFDDGCVVIYSCGYGEDRDLCDGILRTIMFKAMLSGTDKARCEVFSEGKNLFDLMHYPNSENIIESIDNFLNSCKKCKEM